MIRRKIPNDNSCLFSAVEFLTSSGTIENSRQLRFECTSQIRKFPDKYTTLYLDRTPDEYCTWLELDSSWGGEIEILILAEIKGVQISIVQLETLRILSYSPPNMDSCCGRIYLLYTGQHYDALVGNGDLPTYIFHVSQNDGNDCNDSLALACAKHLKHEWETNLRTRTRKRIKCSGCSAILKDASDFQQHCNSVEHDDDFCYDCEDVEITEIVENVDDN